MAAYYAIQLINLCAREVNDIGFERVAKSAATVTAPNQANWLDLLNDAQRAVVLVRPDAGSHNVVLDLAVGSQQALTYDRMLGAVRNMGRTGAIAPGRAIRFVKREDMDAIDPDWHTRGAAQSSTYKCEEVIYDDKKSPNFFYVNPPAPLGPGGVGLWKIEVEVCKTPDDVASIAEDGTGLITLYQQYTPPMQAWMLHRHYAMATQSASQFQRAQFYFQSFFQQLGVKLKADMFGGAASQHMLPSGGGVSV